MTRDLRIMPAIFFCIFLCVGAYFFSLAYQATKSLSGGNMLYVVAGIFFGVFLCVLGLSMRKDKEGRNMWERFKNKE